MLALQGYYENGKLNLPENAPTKGKVYVIFTEENNSDLQIFDKFNTYSENLQLDSLLFKKYLLKLLFFFNLSIFRG